jgi:hypothetical protein
MNQEKKNSIKWIATLMAIIVLFAGVGAALGLAGVVDGDEACTVSFFFTAAIRVK